MILTRRLRCEPVSVHHAEIMYPVLLDERIYTYLPEKPPASVEALRKRYEFLSTGKSPDGTEYWLNWMLFKQDTGEPIGFFQATVRPPSCSIAYVFNPGFWQQGYAAEAGGAIITHLFERYKLSTIIAEIDKRNTRSIRLVKGLGLSFVSHDPESGDDIFEIDRAGWLEKHPLQS
jgi:[ribosomal protein S5]-alanine N-acetyltransferase